MKTLDRFITLHGRIEEDVTEKVIDRIITANCEYNDIINKNKDAVLRPIVLYVNGFGGGTNDAISIIDTIQTSKCPIYTVCTGYAMSANFLIYLAGHKRYCTEHTTFMYHQAGSNLDGKISDLSSDVSMLKYLDDMTNKFICDRTNISLEKLEEVSKYKDDWYFYADEALKLGVATDLMKNMDVLF